ncbi:MAG: TRAP transporter small permease [Alphaproteobacteria bacterium]|nr:TRAP transporter small permease [Alphaproteobacteria bacterium]
MSTSADPQDQVSKEDYKVPSAIAGRLVWPIRILTFVTAAFMLAIAVVTFVDVTGRYVFNSPIRGGVEVIEFLLGLLIFSALPLVTVKRAHIRVELFDGFMSARFKNIREVVVLLANAGMILFITERMWTTAVEMAEDGELSLHLQLPTAPFVFALSLLAAVSVVVQLYMAWRFVTVDLPQLEEGAD